MLCSSKMSLTMWNQHCWILYPYPHHINSYNPFYCLFGWFFWHGFPLHLLNFYWFNIAITLFLISCQFILVFDQFLVIYHILRTGNFQLWLLSLFYHITNIPNIHQVPWHIIIFILGCCDNVIRSIGKGINNSKWILIWGGVVCMMLTMIWMRGGFAWMTLRIICRCRVFVWIVMRFPIIILCKRNISSSTITLSRSKRYSIRYDTHQFSVTLFSDVYWGGI